MNDWKDVWDLIKPISENGFTEIRFTPVNLNSHTKKFEFFNKLDLFKKRFKHLHINKVSVFVNSFDDFVDVVNFSDGYFLRHGKTCYGVNERFRKKDSSIDGSYDSLKYYRFIFFDIEKADHSGELSEFEQKLFNDFIKVVINNLEKHGLKEPSVISSGVGIHLLYRIAPTSITMGRRNWMKHFLNKELTYLNSKLFVVDGLHDATRILGLPFSWNVKRGKQIKLIKKSDYVNNKFKIKSLRQKKLPEVKINKEDLPSVVNSLEFKLLAKSDTPQGNRQMYLIFQLKCLLRDTNSDYRVFEGVLRKIYGSIDLNYNQGVDGKSYNPRVTLKWCKDNMNWLQKYPDLIELYNDYLVMVNER